jgi:hypothetical protein
MSVADSLEATDGQSALTNPAVYKLGLLGSVRSRTSLVLPPLRAEYLVTVQSVHRCRGLPCGASAEIV